MPAPPSPFDSDSRPVAAIFRSPVFNASEGFVSSQAAGLVRYQPVVVGLYDRGHVPEALDARVVLATRSERLAVKLLGRADGLTRRVRVRAPALVHAHFGTDAVLALPMVRALGVPMVTTLHGYDVSRSTARLLTSGRLSWMRYPFGRRALIRECELFLAVSDALRARAVAAGFPAGRTVTHYNGIDLGRFALGSGGEGATVLHVGRLVEKKGTALLLRAFAEARKAAPAATLVIAGDGPLRPSLERLAGQLGLAGAVRFVGFLPPQEVADLMQRAALVAVPSLTARDGDAEGLPNVVVEAAASGLPVLGSDHSGIPEAIVHGRTGFVVPEGEVEPLAARLGELLAAPERRKRMGAAGRKLVEREFDVVRQMVKLEAHYDALVKLWTRTRTSATR
ncbi:MAG: glycosyltransferase [Pseudomonadota bacterium]